MIAREHRAGADDRRAKVLGSAMHEIAQRGLDAVSMRDIAARAGMSPGHVLYYFESKDALLLAVLRWSEADLAVKRRASLERTRTPKGAIRRFCEWYLPDDASDPRWHLWIQMHARPPRDESSRLALLELLQVWIDDLTLIVGDPDLAERSCALMDGLALDILLDLPGRTRDRALRIAVGALRAELRKVGA